MPVLAQDIQTTFPQPIKLPVPTTSLNATSTKPEQRRRRYFNAYREFLFAPGGSPEQLILVMSEGTNSDFVIIDKRHLSKNTNDASEILTEIRLYLVPQIKDLAHIFRVTRPTIYSWLNGSSTPGSEHYQRIQQVHTFVLDAKSAFKGTDKKILHESLSKSQLVGLLQHEQIPRRLILTQIEQVAFQARHLSGQKAARKRIDIIARGAALGNPPRGTLEQQAEIDILTGKGYASESN